MDRAALRPGEAVGLWGIGGLGVHAVQIAHLVGANAVLAEAAGCLGRSGRLLMIGLSLDPIQLGPGVVFGLASQSLLGHLGYAKRHLDELVELVSHGRLDVTGSISGTMPLEDVGRGVRQLATKEGSPIRLVVTP